MGLAGQQLLVGGTSGLKVGDSFGGGIVFWLDGNGGGMVVATSPLPADAIKTRWDLFIDVSGADGAAIGDGYQNNLDIIAAGSCNAVNYVWDYVAGGKSDWFLPSQGELQEVHNTVRQLITYPTDNLYWSSTENPSSPASQAMALRPWNGGFQGYAKGSALYCLPVRRFTSEEDPTEYLNYKFQLYTQDQYKSLGGGAIHRHYTWNGTDWDLFHTEELSNSTYPNTQSRNYCLAVPKNSLHKIVLSRFGGLQSYAESKLLNRKASQLETSVTYSQYGVYGSISQRITSNAQTQEATFYITVPDGTQDGAACPPL